jgi:hypothetical protein
VIFVIVVVYILIATGVFQDKRMLSESEVETVVLWSQGSTLYSTLNIEDTKKFIELYNNASYRVDDNLGTTAEYGVIVNLKDGTKLKILQFGAVDRDYEVFLDNEKGEQLGERYYISSDELKSFLQETLKKHFN